MPSKENDYPYADTAAVQMLSSGLRRASDENGTSLREVGRRLGYKQAVVLSHMATGRVPIPVDRAPELARALDLPMREFVQAVLRQRFPELEWHKLLADGRPPPGSPADFIWSLEKAAGRSIAELTPEQLRIMREVAASPDSPRRWLSVHEVGVIEMLRRVKPNLPAEGLSRADSEGIEALLE